MMQPLNDKHIRTLEAARTLFFDKGFSATSGAEIARAAGTSKAAIYKGFGSKEGLLAAVIEAEVDRFGTSQNAEIVDFTSFREATVAFGTELLAFLNRPQTVHFSRMINEEARARPEVTRLYFEAAYEGTTTKFSNMLVAGHPFIASIMDVDRADTAERYMAMLKGHQYERAILGLTQAPYPHPRQTSEACFDAWFKRADDQS